MITSLISGYLYDASGSVTKKGTLSLRLQQDIVSVDGFKIAPFQLALSLLPLVSPGAPVVTQVGTPGATTNVYEVSALDGGGGETLVGSTTTTTAANATLNGTNYNHIAWSAVSGAVTYNVYGRTGGVRVLLGSTAGLAYDDKGTSIGTAKPSSNTSGGYVYLNIAPTDGATPDGVGYFVEYDPDPTDISQPARNKDGYWSNYWDVPNTPSTPLGNFVSANRGLPLQNYMPLGGTITSVGDELTLGASGSATNKRLRANQSGFTPEIRFNNGTLHWELSNDGSSFEVIATPSVGDITGVIAGTGLSGGGLSGDVTINIATQSYPSWLTAVAWSVIDKTGSSLADLATRSAGDLSSGTLPDARFPETLPVLSGINLTAINASNLGSGTVPLARLSGITNTQIDVAAAIAWSKIDKTSSSLADLATRSASDLSSGTVPDARFPATLPALSATNLTNIPAANLTGTVPLAALSGITNTQISGSAAIAYSKLALTGAIVNADLSASAAIAYSKLNIAASILNGDIASGAAIAYSKLALGSSIVNADISGSAAIGYAKLNLATSIVNADISVSAAIDWAKVSKSGSSLADLATRDASDLLGTLADARLSSNVFYVDGTRAGVSLATSGNAFVYTAASLSSGALFKATIPASAFTGRILSIVDNAGSPADKFVIDANGAITVGTIPYASVSSKSVVNADVSNTAAIAYSKLALSGSILDADINPTAAISYSKLALTNTILNADIGSAAAIAYTKLALTNTIVNADIGSAAAIAYTKLALTNTIVNADIASAAAIAYTKLNLSTSIVNADISASAAIAWSKISKTSSSLADLATRSASDLSSGTVPVAQLPLAGTTTGTIGAVYVDNSTIIVDGSGKITAIGAAPTGPVGGDLTDSLPSPTVRKLRGLLIDSALATNAILSGQVLRWNNEAAQWEVSTDGSQLTSLNASNLGSGTVPVERLGNAVVVGALPDGTVGAPTLAPFVEASTGLWYQRVGFMSFSSLGTETMRFGTDLQLANTLKWASAIGSTADVYLRREAAGRLSMRDGVNAQTYDIYNTFTDSTHYERGTIGWASNELQIYTDKGSAGGSTRALKFGVGGSMQWQIDVSGNLAALGSQKVIAPTLGPATGQQHTVPAVASDTIALIAATQTFTNKTLTTPTISDHTNATHNHQNAAGGGTLDVAAIASGTLGVTRGGTGLASYAVGDIPYASASTTLSKLAAVATGQVLISQGVATAPAWSAVPTLTSIALGSNPSTTGAVAMANNVFVKGRNAANSADKSIIGLNSSNVVSIDADATGAQFGGALTVLGITNLAAFTEAKSALTISSNTITPDCTAANVFTFTHTANITTTTLTNPASGKFYAATWIVTYNGSTFSWSWLTGTVKWGTAGAPTLTATNGKVDAFMTFTVDGGTTWYGLTLGQAF
jgi:hypothetical protein